MTQIEQISKSFIEPLCDATRELLAPLKLAPNDRLEVELSDDGNAFICQAYGLRLDNTMTQGSANAMRGWAQRLPERKELGYGRWQIKATDFAVIVINAVWPRECITWKKGADTLFDYLLTRFVQQTVNAKIKANFKINGELPQRQPGWLEHPKLPPTKYQLVAAHTSMNAEGAALFMEQGTGKTPTGILRIMNEARAHYKKTGRMYRTIVVCPKNVRTNWRDELVRFAVVPGKVAVLRGGQLDRVKQLVDVMTPDEDSEWAVVVCSYETVQRSWDALRMIEWDLAIADESHLIKSVHAKRTHNMLALRDNAKQRMVFTGTPIANTILDLYYQLEFLGAGMSGFSSWKAFREYYSRYISRDDGTRQLVGFQNLPILQERLARVAFMITKKEAMPELPEKSYDIEEVSLTKKQRDYYLKVSKELAAEIEQDMVRAEAAGLNPKITANNVLTKLLRLAQITAGYMVMDKVHDEEGKALVDGDKRITFFPEIPKMDRLMEILRSKGPKEKTIVWACWIPIIKEIERRCKAEGINCVTYYGGTSDDERDRIKREFNTDASIKVFIGNPAAGGVGLNLPGYVPDHEGTDLDHGCNADHTIFYVCDWSMIKRSQAEDRNHGKNRNRVPVRVTDLCTPGTIDEEIRVRVMEKTKTALEIQDIRDILTRLTDVDLTDMD